MATIPETRLIRQAERASAASVTLVPRGEEIQGRRFLYQIVTDDCNETHNLI